MHQDACDVPIPPLLLGGQDCSLSFSLAPFLSQLLGPGQQASHEGVPPVGTADVGCQPAWLGKARGRLLVLPLQGLGRKALSSWGFRWS